MKGERKKNPTGSGVLRRILILLLYLSLFDACIFIWLRVTYSQNLERQEHWDLHVNFIPALPAMTERRESQENCSHNCCKHHTSKYILLGINDTSHLIKVTLKS